MTYKEYKTWEERQVCEVIDGKVISCNPVINLEQNNVCTQLMVEFAKYSRGKDIKVYPYVDVYILEDPGGKWIDENVRSWVIPDLSIVCDANKIKQHGIVGAPDLIVEVINVNSVKIDRLDKFKLYEAAGVREYLIIDPLNKTFESYGLQGNRLELKQVFGRKNMFYSQVFIDLVIDLNDVFE
ncbi:endonuclease [Bacillus cereus]|nr:endonuclease [Bacillus cereus]